MNAAVYPEPYKLPAGILALAVHGLFFAFLYFGFSWQTQTPPVMSVELWQSLPDPAPTPPVMEVVKEAPPPPAKVEPVVKPDIVMPDKKPEKKIEPPKPPPEKPRPEPNKPVEVKKPVNKPVNKPAPAVLAAQQQAARDKAAQEAATGRVVDEYIAKISGKIRRNIVMPPDVPSDARAEFLVTLLPGGRVLDVKLKKSSGNAAYDSAVERSILKSDPLPLPPDAGLFNRFRELRLGFQPVE